MHVRYSPELAESLTNTQQEEFERITTYWFHETRRRIDVPDNMVFTVKPSPIEYGATGLGGFCRNATNIDLRLTVSLFGLAKEEGIPIAVPHECHHAVKGFHGETWQGPIMEAVIAEGLASAFESEVSGIQSPMSQYPPEVNEWLEEIKAVGDDWDYHEWFSGPNEDRYHIGYKVGKYIVDKALENRPDQTAGQLVHESTEEILNTADISL